MSRSAAGAVVAFFAVSLSLVVTTPWCTRDRVADPAAWRSALQANLDVVKPGDVVLVHPPWRDDVVAALRTLPLPPGATVTDAFSPRHAAPWPPVVVVREDGGLPLPRALSARVDAASARVAGGVRIERLRRAPGDDGEPGGGGAGRSDARDLSDDLAAAVVEVHAPHAAAGAAERVVRCPWDALQGKHVCPGLPPWMHVGVEELPVGGRTVRCTWSHPITGGSVHVRFPGEPLDDTLTLALALTDGAADNRTAAPVSASVLVDGKPVLSATKPPGQRGFVTKTAHVTPHVGDVELVVTTPMDGQRHTCFRLTTSPATSPAGSTP